MMLNRFCLQILPEIHDKIKWFNLESSSMKHILCARNYPNLYALGLYNIDEDLIYLSLYESSYKNRLRLCFDDPPPPTFHSSTLQKLNIKIRCFDDCLYLLDGRFNQLNTLFVDFLSIQRPEEIHNQSDLPNLKCFSLSCNYETNYYDELILPLLYRMSNLEQISLYIAIFVDETFIDGNNLKRNIINRMPRLNQFRFYIRSLMLIHNQVNLPSTEGSQCTFIDFSNNNIISNVNYFPEARKGRCHIYSYPSRMQYYSGITNNFPGGLYTYVRVVLLLDEHPFEHEFFLRIQKSFPFMEQLSLINHKSQNRKQSSELNNDNRNLSVIQYSFLNALDIVEVHDDYIEQFLFDTKTHLQNNVLLCINYKSLKRVTHNFTRDATRINCTKINELILFAFNNAKTVKNDNSSRFKDFSRYHYLTHRNITIIGIDDDEEFQNTVKVMQIMNMSNDDLNSIF
ncbi:unnamed protein product [Rotaria sordida]|uniref:Uncharacterized protein n=2 Tax=Rotaria sordida TaxID=392033 RepID=A0A819BQS2_9BILA|nr:unnamed protein product [Rotaria sordida]